ncbi:MAG TPA: xanthine dehydrogenase family protein molybdopterin-binding subunit [Chloroflexota bacterium]|nr:xanthine dehydrogenase family protein molybdopterin-binding subunit [Chloroflexota bacterium]
MTSLHIDVLRSGEGKEGEYKVAEEDPLPNWTADTKLTVVGTPLPRVEGPEKVTGRAKFAYDVHLPAMLFSRVLRSPHPHARITRIDSSKAEALFGVRGVLHSGNAPEIEWYKDSALFDTTLRFVGEEVAAVAADSEEIAEDALRLIDVEYDVLPFIADFTKALDPDAPALHEKGNVATEDGEPKVYERGDVEAGFGQADVVVEEEFVTPAALHNCMETHGCVAQWEGDRLTLWDSTQSIFDVREEVAKKLKLPEHKVRVIKQYMGGGFGSKQIAWKHTVIAALLSKRTGRPVQLMLDREAENLAVGNRNPTRQRLRIGARKDGTLTAISVKIEQSVGAHMVGGEGSNTPGLYQRLYRCPNLRTEQWPLYANTGPAVAFRAPGYVEAAWALEQAMDMLARELDMDSLDLRLKNYAVTDQKRDKPFTEPESLRRCYAAATEAFGWRAYRKPDSHGPRRRGIGIAAHEWGGSGYPPGYAWVKLNADGTADVVTGTQDIGTGTRTSLTQIAAEELGLPVAQVAVHLGDTAQGPYAPVSSGSATQPTIGPAVRAAAADARRQLLRAAGTYLEVDPLSLRVQDGKIFVEGESGHATTVEEVTQRIAPHMIQGHGARGANPEDKSIRTFGVQCAEVEVDVETGEVRVLRIVASHDCGRIVNPTLVESQVVGGVTQGIGFALSEERVVDMARGVVMNANLEEYKVPVVVDVPPIEHARVDLADPAANHTGSKGIGEPPTVPTAPAIANAVFDAVGVRITEAPITRARLLAALAAKESAR